MEKNVSLIFVNNHFREEWSWSLPPLSVNVGGGMHCTAETWPLSPEIQEFFNAAGENGFIYFSFSTFANAGNLQQTIEESIFQAMATFPQIKCLVKWDVQIPKGLPKNAKTFQWISQQEVLAHPKIKAFISHGGLLGTQEAAFHGVPMVVLPLFADQDLNAKRIENTGRGVRLEISGLTQKKLEDAIREVISNPKYETNSKKVSTLFRDRENKPEDTALYWVEYVLRHKDTSFLRPVGMQRTWYERRMLDVWAFVLVIGILSISLVGGFLRISIKLLHKYKYCKDASKKMD